MSNYNVRSNVISNYTTRPAIVSYDYITWNESVDTWNSVTETWNDYYSWFIEWTQYTVRPIIA